MHKNQARLQRFIHCGLFLMMGFSMTACSEEKWKEEVLLHDGSKIIVTRTHSRGGRGEIGQSPIKEHAIEFTLPGSSKTIIWKDEYSDDVHHSNFDLIALHILDGTPYIVTTAYGCLAFNKWGRPNPPYIIFKYVGGTWQRIPISELPLVFNDINLVINSSAYEKDMIEENHQSGFVSIASIKKFNDSSSHKEYKSIVRDPFKNEGPEGCPVMVRTKDGWSSPYGFKAPVPVSPSDPDNKK